MEDNLKTRVNRLETVISLGIPDRVPSVPLIAQFALRYRGVPQSDGYRNPQTTNRALVETFDALGGWDGQLAANLIWVNSSWRISAAPMPMRVPGRQAGDNEPLQAVEMEIFTKDDYEAIIKRGWNGFLAEFLPRATGRPLEKIDATQKKLLKIYMDDVKTWHEKGVPVLSGATTCDPTMILSLSRTLSQFTLDLYRQPDMMQAVMDAMVDDLIQNVLDDTAVTGLKYVFFPLERGSGFFYPLRIFERFGFPYIKKMADAFAAAGLISILHFDTDWTLNLPYLKDLPRGKCICELDSRTDIFKAKEILKGHMCIMGDVPATLLSLGTEEEVVNYCNKLHEVVGKDGGFILSTGCECPIDAKFENVKAMLATARSHTYPGHDK